MSAPVSPYPQYVSPAEASQIVGVSPRTLRRAIQAQQLRAHSLGRLVRIEITELTRWVQADGAGETSTASTLFRRVS